MESGNERDLNKTFVAQLASILTMIGTKARKLEEVVRWMQVMIAEDDFIKRLDAPQAVRQMAQEVKEALLQLIGTVSVPAMPALGKVKDVFKVDTSETAEIDISYVDSFFLECFDGMEISDFAGSELCCQMLMRDAKDGEILRALGGENKAETGLFEIYWLMKQQGNGEDGILLTDGKANIFYVRDKNGILRAVSVSRSDNGWNVRANEIGNGNWYSIGRVFSRNFL